MCEGLVVVGVEGGALPNTKKWRQQYHSTIVLTKRRLPNRDIAQNFDEIFQLPFHCAAPSNYTTMGQNDL